MQEATTFSTHIILLLDTRNGVDMRVDSIKIVIFTAKIKSVLSGNSRLNRNLSRILLTPKKHSHTR